MYAMNVSGKDLCVRGDVKVELQGSEAAHPSITIDNQIPIFAIYNLTHGGRSHVYSQ